MKKFRLLLPAAAFAATAGISPLAAQLFEGDSPISANIGVTSNYVFRGVTQTDNSAAVQGGLDYESDMGIYVGTWASNVDFGAGGEAEVDVYGGYAGSIEAFDYDVGVIGYLYPNSDDANFYEAYAEAAFEFAFVGAAYTFASDVSDGAFNTGDVYVYGGVGFDLWADMSLGLTVGYYFFDDVSDADYLHGQVDLTKATDFGDFSFSVSLAEEESGDDDPLVFASWGIGF